MRNWIATIVLGLVLVAPAFAWHEAGHKATAAIAFEQMSHELQQEVISILRVHPRYREDFASLMPDELEPGGNDAALGKWLLGQASVWPDLVPRLGDDVRTRYHRGSWHYINLPVWLEDKDQPQLERKLDHNRAMNFEPPLRQNLNIVQALKGNLAVWHDADASDAAKAVALCWIAHLVGDLHQPLHTVALFSAAYFPEGDRGGNSIEVRWEDENRNLHAVWDSLPTAMPYPDPVGAAVPFASQESKGDDTIDTWLYQHAGLARQYVYTDALKTRLLANLEAGVGPVVSVDQYYLDAALKVARQQVKFGGYRLAALLE